MANASDTIAKAGWLYRKSTIVHRWKKQWFVLYRDGMLKYFDSPDKYEFEEVAHLPLDLLAFRVRDQCKEENPPDGRGRNCLMTLILQRQGTWHLCAETPDDLKAWEMAITDGRNAGRPTVGGVYPVQGPQTVVYQQGGYLPSYGLGGYGGYPGQVLSTAGTQQVIHTTTGYPGQTNVVYTAPPIQQTVIVDDGLFGPRYGRYGHRYCHRGYDGGHTTYYAGAPPATYW